MKTKLLFAALSAVFVLPSCNHESPDLLSDGEEEAVVSFNVSGTTMSLATKASQTEDESAVNNVDILVFNPDGKLNAMALNSGVPCSVRLTKAATLKCYALVNRQDSEVNVADVKTEQELLSKVTALENERQGGFKMIGSAICNAFVSSEFTIPVHRFASKVTLEKINLNLSSTSLASAQVKLQGIYLVNVTGQVKYGIDGWYPAKICNSRNFVKADADALQLHVGANNMNQILPSGVTQVNKNMYCYPNPTIAAEDTQGKTSGKAMTRLVVELEFNGTRYYYPVNIASPQEVGGQLFENRHYIVKQMTVTGLGSSSPDVIPSFDNVQFQISVADWENEITESVVY